VPQDHCQGTFHHFLADPSELFAAQCQIAGSSLGDGEVATV
jgi:hypothetical protein